MSLVGLRPYSAGRINGNDAILRVEALLNPPFEPSNSWDRDRYLPRECVRDHEDGIRRFSVHVLEHSVESSRSEEELLHRESKHHVPSASRSRMVGCNPNGSDVTPRIQRSMRSTATSMKAAFARSASLEKYLL
jgi:hypothetical protein